MPTVGGGTLQMPLGSNGLAKQNGMRLPRISKETFRLAQDSAILVNAGVLSGILFLLVHPLLGRLMEPVEYAVFVQLMGLVAVLGVPASAVQVAITRYVAEYAHGSQVALWRALIRRATRRLAWWGGGALMLWCAASGVVADWLRVDAFINLWIIGIAAVVSLFLPIFTGSLQGSLRFGWLAASTLGAGGLRLLFVGVAVGLHGGVTGVLIGVTASMVGGLLIAGWPLRGTFRNTSPAAIDTRPMYRYLWPVLGGQAVVFLLMNADLILSARLLTPADLAVYGKVATLSRTVLFIAQPIAMAMFPRAVNSSGLRMLLIPMGAAFGITLAAAVALTILPGLPMQLMYGVSGPEYNHLTRLYIWAALPLSMCMFLAQYLWARHQPWRVLLALLALFAYLAVLAHGVSSPEALIAAVSVGGWLSMLLLGGAVLIRRGAVVTEARAA